VGGFELVGGNGWRVHIMSVSFICSSREHADSEKAKRLPMLWQRLSIYCSNDMSDKKIGPRDGFLLLPHHFSAKLSGETLC
jgi:hypothetical protein